MLHISQRWGVSGHNQDSKLAHRHDIGEVSHGATTQETVTKAVQMTLAICVIGTAFLVIYALSVSSGAL